MKIWNAILEFIKAVFLGMNHEPAPGLPVEEAPKTDKAPATSNPKSTLVLPWEATIAGAKEWTKALSDILYQHLSTFEKASDITRLHPKWNVLTLDEKIRVLGNFICAIAKFESSWNPKSNAVDVGTKNNKDTWSVGLMQMSVTDQKNYRFTTDYSFEDLQKAVPNLDLAVRVMAALILKKGKIFIANTSGPYWSTIAPGNKYDKTEKILAMVSQTTASLGSGEAPEVVTGETPDPSESIADKILAKNKFIDKRALSRALKWHQSSKITNKDVMMVVNFNLNDAMPRLHLINMKTFDSQNYKVAHGKNSDPNKDGMPTEFSNVSGSYKSSLGAILVGDQFKNPKWKFVRLLHGLEPGLNDKIRAREILMHSTTYVNDTPGKAVGDTLGCFGVSEASGAKIFPVIKGCLLYSWDDSLEG